MARVASPGCLVANPREKFWSRNDCLAEEQSWINHFPPRYYFCLQSTESIKDRKSYIKSHYY